MSDPTQSGTRKPLKHDGTTSRTLVEYTEITKRYGTGEGAVTAIEDFSGSINQGEFVSVVGPSGCGKTTLLHLAAGLIEPTEGSISIDGVDVVTGEHEKHKVGLVFQKPVLLQWRTILKNVLLPVEVMIENGILDGDMDYYRQRGEELLDLVGLKGFEDAYPRELSGGMQQRAAICRSLIYDPPLLLMDEPFGALDALTRDKLNDELLRIWQKTDKTIIFITHNLEEAVYLSDRIFVLSNRPATLLDDIKIDLDRPRQGDTRASTEYQRLVTRTSQYFKEI